MKKGTKAKRSANIDSNPKYIDKENKVLINDLDIKTINEIEVLTYIKNAKFVADDLNTEIYKRNSEWLLGIASGCFFLFINLITNKSELLQSNVSELIFILSVYSILVFSCFMNRNIDSAISFNCQLAIVNLKLWEQNYKDQLRLNGKVSFQEKYWEAFSNSWGTQIEIIELKNIAFEHGLYLTGSLRFTYKTIMDKLTKHRKMKTIVNGLMYASFGFFIYSFFSFIYRFVI